MKNYELVSKAKVELQVFQQYFTPHTPPLKQGWSETRPPQHTHYTLNNSFPSLFQIVLPNVRSRDPLRPASNNEIHTPSFSPIRIRTF